MTYCVVHINCLPLPRFLKEVTMKTAEERYEETWNSYLELLNKDPRTASLLHYLCTGKCTVRATFEMDMKRRKASSRQIDKERQCIKDRTKSVHKKIQAKASNKQGPRLRPSANESEGRMKHTEGQAHSEERAALPFKGTRIREPRSRTARQQYRSHPTT